MVAYNKINNFDYALGLGQINFSTSAGHTFSVLLSNSAPTSTFKTAGTSTTSGGGDWVSISTGNGYTNLGSTCQITSYANANNTLPVIVLGPAAGVVITASGGSIGPFRYVGLVDQSTAYGGNAQLVSFYDFGSNVTLNSGETFTVTFDPSSGILQIN
jgi:hypothetical protein